LLRSGERGKRDYDPTGYAEKKSRKAARIHLAVSLSRDQKQKGIKLIPPV